MESAVTKASAGKSWRRLVVGLMLFILLPAVFQVIFPVIAPMLMLVPIIAVCSIVGWLGGGKLTLALIWVALAVLFLIIPANSGGSSYDVMARGWALMLAGSFGLLCLWSSATPFIVRALGALGLAIGTGFILAISFPGGVDRFERAASSEFTKRSKETVAQIRLQAGLKRNRELAAASPSYAQSVDLLEAGVLAAPRYSAVLLPSLLALESLAGLALGWAIYQRLGGDTIGPRLSSLSQFKFNDQLIWGVAVGATLVMLPPFEEGRNAGYNLLVFFGTLYFVRGLGVIAWFTNGRRRLVVGAFVSTFLLALIAPPIGSFFFMTLSLFTVGAAMVLGLGDTWLDWRSRPAAG